MKKLIIKLLSFCLSMRYFLLAYAYWQDSNDQYRLWEKFVSISKSLSFLGVEIQAHGMTINDIFKAYGGFL